MAQLFASHLVEEVTPMLIPGRYDPEQELWVGDNNQPLALAEGNASPNLTGRFTLNTTRTFLFLDTDVDEDFIPD